MESLIFFVKRQAVIMEKILLLNVLLFCALHAVPQKVNAQLADNFIIDYTDLDRYDEAIDAINAGADPYDIFLSYYGGGGRGLKNWLGTLNASTERVAQFMAKRVTEHPDWAEIPYGSRKIIEPYEARLRSYYRKLQALSSESTSTSPILPTYFIVAILNGSGSWTATGSYIAMGSFSPVHGKSVGDIKPGEVITEYLSDEIEPEYVLQVAVHEMVHFYQFLNQGSTDYLSMYTQPGEDTLIARAVREGAAEYIAYKASNLTMGETGDITSRHGYVQANEKKLWAIFRSVMFELEQDHSGWFSGTYDELPDMPFQIGYSLGFAMIEAYYQSQTDKDAAINFIYNAHKPQHFEKIIASYEEKFSE